MDSEFITLSCTSGFLHPDEGDFGITPSDSADKNICQNTDFTRGCSNFIDTTKAKQYIHDQCHDKTSCQVNLGEIRNSMSIDASDRCKVKTAAFFIQAPCKFHQDELDKKQVQGLIIACMGVFIALFFVVYVDYLKSVFKNLNIEWDVKTITAGDYSVELDLSEKMWKSFEDHEAFNKNSAESKLAQFRDFLKKSIEDNLT